MVEGWRKRWVELEHSSTKNRFPFRHSLPQKKNKATTKLRKKKEDDILSDNRFKLHNEREVSTLSLFLRFSVSFFNFIIIWHFQVFEEKAYLVGVECKNDV